MSKIIRSSDVITINDYSKQYRKADSIVAKSMEEAEKMLIEASENSETIVHNARLEAAKIVADARAEAEQRAKEIQEEASERGYSEGYNEGRESGYSEGYSEGKQSAYDEMVEEKKAVLDEANAVKKSYLEEREKILNSIETDVIALVKSIVEKVVNREMERDDYMVELILKGLKSLNDKDGLVIRVSKDDYEQVAELKPEILSKGSLIEDIDIKLDSNLEKGDCVIESLQGNVNSSVSLQVEEMKKTLDDLLLGE